MSQLSRLVSLVFAEYRWGVHPLKVLAALLLPVLIVWLGDRHVRRAAAGIADREAKLARLPRIRRR